MPESLLAIENVTVSYGRGRAATTALRDASASFPVGQLTLVSGPSGSGKTTLLCVLGCLLTPDRGSVYFGGRDVAGVSEGERTSLRQRQIGFVFQAFRMFRALTALENVAIAGDLGGQRAAKGVAWSRLDELGLSSKAHLKPDSLSGGEKQRIAIARALLKNPSVLLADEPTASLDSEAGRQICESLHAVAARQRRTVVVVSHDPRWEEFADARISLHDGRIVGEG